MNCVDVHRHLTAAFGLPGHLNDMLVSILEALHEWPANGQSKTVRPAYVPLAKATFLGKILPRFLSKHEYPTNVDLLGVERVPRGRGQQAGRDHGRAVPGVQVAHIATVQLIVRLALVQ